MSIVRLVDPSRSTKDKPWRANLHISAYNRLKKQGRIDNWILLEEFEKSKPKNTTTIEVDEDQFVDVEEISSPTIEELRAELDSLGIKYNQRSKEKKLMSQLDGARGN